MSTIEIDPEDVVTASQIAKRFGLSRNAVFNWIARYPDFPGPVLKTEVVRLWSWAAVEAWASQGLTGEGQA